MLDKSKLEYLNKQGRYDEICLIFKQEFQKMFKDFFFRNNIECYDNCPILYYTGLLYKHFGEKYKDVIKILDNNLGNENQDVYEEVYSSITIYNYVAKRLKE